MTTVEGGDDAWDDELLIQEYNRSVRLLDQRIEELESNGVATGDGIVTSPMVSGSVGEVTPTLGVMKSNEVKKDKKRNKKKSDSNELLWKPGDHCKATFKEDGAEYEAKIISIDHKYGYCVIKYLGYDNEEYQYLQDLKPSAGVDAQLAQMQLFLSDEIPVQDGVDDEQEDNCDLEDDQDSLILDNPTTVDPSRPEFIMPEIHTQSNRESPKAEFILPPPPTFLTNNLSEPLSKESDALASMLMSWYMCGFQTGYYTALKQIKGKD